jgi:hypothetical protein
MIKVIFPPGGYGTYLARCIYTYTNLRQEEFVQLEFDTHGSSHAYRQIKESKKYIQCEHIDTFVPDVDSKIIVVLPNRDHSLDYYNNQFHKQEHGQLVSYLTSNFTSEEISNKLTQHWNFNKTLSENTPTWILREWCSFWLEDGWNYGYNRDRYGGLKSDIQIDTQDLVELFDTIFLNLITKLNLTLTVDPCIIKKTHVEFRCSQKFHNSQLKSKEWVNCIINNEPMVINCPTIFTEAYIQKLLRDKGYEIYCDNLNIFPTLSTDMKKLIYQV